MSECKHRINKEMIDILDKFDHTLTRKDVFQDTNKLIGKAIDQYYVQNNKDGMLVFMKTLLISIEQGGELVVPYITTHSILSKEQLNSINIGDTFTLDHDVKLKLETVKDVKGNEWVGVFTSTNEMHKGSSGNVQINQSILSILKSVLDLEEVNDIVINPFGKHIQINKNMIALLISRYNECAKES